MRVCQPGPAARKASRTSRSNTQADWADTPVALREHQDVQHDADEANRHPAIFFGRSAVVIRHQRGIDIEFCAAAKLTPSRLAWLMASFSGPNSMSTTVIVVTNNQSLRTSGFLNDGWRAQDWANR